MHISHTSYTEENYIKAIFKLQEITKTKAISTNDIAERLFTQPATVTDMMKRLAEKKIVTYKKYYGVYLTAKGEKIALDIIRKHRLWEVFLVTKLNFKWDEVHDIAEQLEHINSDDLITKLDNFLGNPKFDPHGDAIPDKHGKMQKHADSVLLSSITKTHSYIFCGVANHETRFLQYLNTLKLTLGNTIQVESINSFDSSYKVRINNKHSEFFSAQIASYILVQPINGR